MFLEKLKRVFFPDYFASLSAGRKTAMLGIFIALAVLANVLSIDVTPALKISFTYLTGFFTGAIFGPLIGFAVCFFGDIVAFLLPTGGGVYWPLTGVCTGLLALIPGLVMHGIKFNFKGGVFVKIAISVVLTYLFVTCTLGAYSNYLYVKYVVYAGREYGKAFAAYLGGKILFSTVVSGINYLLIFLMVPLVNSIKPLKMKIE